MRQAFASLVSNIMPQSDPMERPLEQETNALGQPVGPPVPGWTPPPAPAREPLAGRYCLMEPLDADHHAQSLFDANQLDKDGRTWTYLAYGPFPTFESYREWAARAQA